MDAREAERRVFRRAMALARERLHVNEQGTTVAVQIAVTLQEGRWCAGVSAFTTGRGLVNEHAEAGDPTAALCVLPAVLGDVIEGVIGRLRTSLREGVDAEVEPEPTQALALTPPAKRQPSKCGHCGSYTHRANHCPERQGHDGLNPTGRAPQYPTVEG